VHTRLLSGLTVALALICALALPAFAADNPRTITVRGTGTAAAAPDTAELSAGIVEQAPTAAAAMAAVTKQAAQMLQAMRDFGIADRDLQTTGLLLHPVYPRQRDDEAEPKPIAFRAATQVNVRLRDIDRSGALLDRLLTSGVNQFNGIRFTIAEPAPLLAEARRKAMADARARAELYAKELGGEVGPVLSVREDLASLPRPTERLMTARAAAPIATGEQEIEAAVSIVFELK
jgi:uncharacterized protein YggE